MPSAPKLLQFKGAAAKTGVHPEGYIILFKLIEAEMYANLRLCKVEFKLLKLKFKLIQA